MPSDRMRASDSEREHVVGLLRTAATEGRLDVEELDERTAAAYRAKTRGELTQLLIDLPAAHLPASSPRPQPPTPRRPWPTTTGLAGFYRQWIVPAGKASVLDDLYAHVGPPLQRSGYEVELQTHDRIVFRHDQRPWWTYLLAVILFPVGLVALVHKDQRRVTIELHERGGQTAVTVSGIAPLEIRRALAAMER